MRFQTTAKQLFQQASDSLFVQAFRFIVVGLVAFAVDYSLLLAAVLVWQWNYLASAAVAYSVGLTLNYCLCVRWVFPQRRFSNPKQEFILFAVIGVAGLFLTELILWTGKEWLGLDVAVSKLIALFAVAVWNFALRKAVLFSKGSHLEPGQIELGASQA